MKLLTIFSTLLVVSMMTLTSCITPGDPTSNVLPLSGFDEIAVRAPIDLQLKQDANFRVEVVADSFWQARLDIDVVGNILEISLLPDSSGGINDSTPLYDVDVIVQLPDLKRLDVLSAAKISTDNRFVVNDLSFNILGAADMSFEADASDVDINISGAANLDLDMDMDALDAKIDGAGRLKAEGQTVSQNVEILGAGTVEAFDLVSDSCVVEFLGAGKVEVMAQNQLDVKIVGAGLVYYKGAPVITQSISGLGQVIDAN